mmetsp:Transcript_82595/g.155615  ORF Transcript_82595/g.155615 Transcript_82595/m.155615 type:complete len:114 (-) Transcript_82595:114-455(-)
MDCCRMSAAPAWRGTLVQTQPLAWIGITERGWPQMCADLSICLKDSGQWVSTSGAKANSCLVSVKVNHDSIIMSTATSKEQVVLHELSFGECQFILFESLIVVANLSPAHSLH